MKLKVWGSPVRSRVWIAVLKVSATSTGKTCSKRLPTAWASARGSIPTLSGQWTPVITSPSRVKRQSSHDCTSARKTGSSHNSMSRLLNATEPGCWPGLR